MNLDLQVERIEMLILSGRSERSVKVIKIAIYLHPDWAVDGRRRA